MPSGANEAFSRVLIDKALEFSGWNLLEPRQVRFELHGATSRADYVLSGQRGPLCVVEAKREDLDPYNPSFTKPRAERLVNFLAPLSYIIDAVKDPEGPFLCLPKIIDLRSDITTKALDELGWAVVVNEQEENFKIKDLEKRIF